jgi:coiled-coil domain-containing protein 55
MAQAFTLKVPGKKYGLVKPKKKTKVNAFAAAFGAADDEEEDLSVNEQLLREQASAVRQKKAEAEYAKALEQDSTAFEYDSVFDAMHEERAQSARSRKAKEAERKPKYIKNIIKMSEFKKREEERATERMEHKQRLKEKAEFGDKEQFITASYKAKLKEWEVLDAEDAKQAALEASESAKSKSNMDSFYVNLMHDNVSMGNMVDKVEEPQKPEAGSAAASGSASGSGAGAGGGGGASVGGGRDGDGVELGIAGGTQMAFEDIGAAAEAKQEAGRRRGACTWPFPHAHRQQQREALGGAGRGAPHRRW